MENLRIYLLPVIGSFLIIYGIYYESLYIFLFGILSGVGPVLLVYIVQWRQQKFLVENMIMYLWWFSSEKLLKEIFFRGSDGKEDLMNICFLFDDYLVNKGILSHLSFDWKKGNKIYSKLAQVKIKQSIDKHYSTLIREDSRFNFLKQIRSSKHVVDLEVQRFWSGLNKKYSNSPSFLDNLRYKLDNYENYHENLWREL